MVAIPSFSEVKVGFSCEVHGTGIFCYFYDVTGKVDSTEANVNSVLFFRVNTANRCNVGRVTIHLHHSTRLVQVQGGAVISGKTTAAVWFVENFIARRFANISVREAFDISAFNLAVREMVANNIQKLDSQDKCNGCQNTFLGRSVRDVCPHCSKHFHRSCLSGFDHPCV